MKSGKIDILAAGIIAGLILLAYLAFFRDSWGEAIALRETKSQLTEELAQAHDINSELSKIKGDIDSMQNKLAHFDRQLSKESGIHDILIEIDRLAKKNRVDMKAISPGKPVKGAAHSWIPVNISGRARFKDFYRFLHELEHGHQVSATERMQVKRSQGKDICDIAMEVAVFVRAT